MSKPTNEIGKETAESSGGKTSLKSVDTVNGCGSSTLLDTSCKSSAPSCDSTANNDLSVGDNSPPLLHDTTSAPGPSCSSPTNKGKQIEMDPVANGNYTEKPKPGQIDTNCVRESDEKISDKSVILATDISLGLDPDGVGSKTQHQPSVLDPDQVDPDHVGPQAQSVEPDHVGPQAQSVDPDHVGLEAPEVNLDSVGPQAPPQPSDEEIARSAETLSVLSPLLTISSISCLPPSTLLSQVPDNSSSNSLDSVPCTTQTSSKHPSIFSSISSSSNLPLSPIPSSPLPISVPLPISSVPLPISSLPLPISSVRLPISCIPLPISSVPLPISSSPLPTSTTLSISTQLPLSAPPLLSLNTAFFPSLPSWTPLPSSTLLPASAPLTSWTPHLSLPDPALSSDGDTSPSEGPSSLPVPNSGSKSYDYLLKVLLVGDSDVGKQEIITGMEDGSLDSPYSSSTGAAYKTTIILIDGKKVKLHIWDTSGQGRFCTIIRSYSRGAQGILLVYDITNRWSFEGMDRWVREVEEHAPGIPKVLVGNRLHLAFKRQVDPLEAEMYAERHNMGFYEISPLVNFNITESFQELCRMALKRNGMERLWRGNRVLPLHELCCHAIVGRTNVYGIDKLPLPEAMKANLKSYALTNYPTNRQQYKTLKERKKRARPSDAARSNCVSVSRKSCAIT